ncbi:hypothetical protein JW949_03815 [Candidatus Woesearchaeota archaeon]|nr:hypothetical protein [Candidatus Woesearchaeota archaeon]
MVISPKEASELTEYEKEKISELEEEIDNTIMNDYIPSKNNVVYFSLKEVTPRITETLKDMYGKAGWEVDYNCEQGFESLEFRTN